MRVFHLHVGNQLAPGHGISKDKILERWSFDDQALREYMKKDIVNADVQMHSLIDAGVDIKYGHFSDRKSPASLFRGGKKLRELCRREKIEVVHVFWGTTTALMTVLFSPVPVVISFSGSDLIGLVNKDGGLRKSAYVSVPLSKIAALFADHIITKSAHMKSLLPAMCRRKTTVIPNGVDLRDFYVVDRDEALAKVGWRKDAQHVIFFNGSGDFVKNQPLAEQAFERIKKEFPQSEFHLLSNIPHHELVYYYNAADLMLLTSFHEGSNNSLKEAMACNTPVVSTNCGDAAERLAGVKNAYVINSYEAGSVAEKCIEILKTGERSDSRKKIQEVSIGHIAGEIIEVYKKVLNK